VVVAPDQRESVGGGDEFAVVMDNVDDPGTAITEGAMSVLRRPIEVAGHSISASVSVGLSFGNGGKSTELSYGSEADTAVYEAKAARQRPGIELPDVRADTDAPTCGVT
jgi:GGDEF domain-containing protein